MSYADNNLIISFLNVFEKVRESESIKSTALINIFCKSKPVLIETYKKDIKMCWNFAFGYKRKSEILYLQNYTEPEKFHSYKKNRYFIPLEILVITGPWFVPLKFEDKKERHIYG